MPTSSQLQVSSALQAFAAGYTNGNFVADIVCPVIQHVGQNGTYHYGSRTDAATSYEDLTGDDSEPNEVDIADATATFTALARSLMGWVSYAKIDNADDPLKPKEQRIANIMRRLMIAEEVRVATALQTTGNYATANTSAAAAKWSDEASGNPVKDIQTMISAVAPGDYGNTKLVLVLALEAFHALSRHPSMLSLRAGGGQRSGVLAAAEIASMFEGLDEIVVTNAEYNTAARGATASYSRIWDTTKAVMVRVPKSEPSMEMEQALFSARFRWVSASQVPFSVVEWDEPKRGPGKGSVGVKVSHWTSVPKIVQNDQGYCLTTVT